MMTMNGQNKLTPEERERLGQAETIAADDSTALCTASGWKASHPSEQQHIEHDPVEHPAHYTSHPSGVECNAIVQHMPYNVGTAMAYLWRHEQKGDPVGDLRKAEWYVRREIQRLTGEQ